MVKYSSVESLYLPYSYLSTFPTCERLDVLLKKTCVSLLKQPGETAATFSAANCETKRLAKSFKKGNCFFVVKKGRSIRGVQ